MIPQWKGGACYVVVESLATLSPVVTGKLGSRPGVLSDLNKISRQNVKDDICLFLLLIVIF